MRSVAQRHSRRRATGTTERLYAVPIHFEHPPGQYSRTPVGTAVVYARSKEQAATRVRKALEKYGASRINRRQMRPRLARPGEHVTTFPGDYA